MAVALISARFLKRYLPLFHRQEQRGHAAAFLQGLLSGLQRKSVEPIARQAGIPRKNLQMFVGQGAWDDEAVAAEMRRHVAEELGEPDGVIVLDPSGFPKKGEDSCGVARDVVRPAGQEGQLPARRLPGLRLVPGARPAGPPALPAPGLGRRPGPPRGLPRPRGGGLPQDLGDRRRPAGPQRGRGAARLGRGRRRVRPGLGVPRPAARRGERYVLDVPCNTTIRDLEGRRRRRRKPGRHGKKREVPFRRVDAWAADLPADRWTRLTIRDGDKGPMEVEAVVGAGSRPSWAAGSGPEERLLVIRTLGAEPELTYSLSNAAAGGAAGRAGGGAVAAAPGRAGVPGGQG